MQTDRYSYLLVPFSDGSGILPTGSRNICFYSIKYYALEVFGVSLHSCGGTMEASGFGHSVLARVHQALGGPRLPLSVAVHADCPRHHHHGQHAQPQLSDQKNTHHIISEKTNTTHTMQRFWQLFT